MPPPIRSFPARLLVCLGLGALPLAAHADIWTVDLVSDENDSACIPGDCSLREAIAGASAGDEIVFALPGPSPWTIRLQSGGGLGTLQVDLALTISGPGADLLAISGDSTGDGTGDLRVLRIATTGALAISGLTLRDGRLTSSGDPHGGCVLAEGEGTFTAVRFENCRAWSGGVVGIGIDGGDGGAIFATTGSTLGIEACIFAGNFAGTGEASGAPPFGRGGRGGALAAAGSAAVVRRSTFSGNHAGDGGPFAGAGGGGGALAALAGTLLVEESTFSGNRSGDGASFQASQGPDGAGGALWVGADTTLNNVTISGNAIGSTPTGTSATGGGLHVASGGVARLRNVTVTGNLASGAGGGIARAAGTLQIAGSVIAGNTGGGTSEDCTGTLVSLGFNLVGVENGCAASLLSSDQRGSAATPLDPGLGPLAANGGPTATHALATGSPAIDAGDPAGCLGWDPGAGTDFPLTVDQRAAPRPTDGDGDTSVICDAGAFEAPTAELQEHLLEVALAGTGSGEVTSQPAGIACPGDCDELYPFGTPVALTATPSPGSAFTGWSGDCTGTGSCDVVLDLDRAVTATFAPLRTLVVSVSSGGSVTSTPAGISCPADCSEAFVDGELVTLTADPAPGFEFTSWSGDCSGAGVCQVTMSQNRAVSATFSALPAMWTLTVAVTGPGSVTSDPAGISCPGDCSQAFVDGTVVTLDGSPGPDAHLVGWAGACPGAGSGSCVFTLTSDLLVEATFDTLPFLDGFESGDTGVWSTTFP